MEEFRNKQLIILKLRTLLTSVMEISHHPAQNVNQPFVQPVHAVYAIPSSSLCDLVRCHHVAVLVLQEPLRSQWPQAQE